MKIVLASQNKKKIVELRTLLCDMIPDIEILSLADVGITGDIVEDGDSFEANALIKARAAAASGYIGVCDDSGLCLTPWVGGHNTGSHPRRPCQMQLLLWALWKLSLCPWAAVVTEPVLGL